MFSRFPLPFANRLRRYRDQERAVLVGNVAVGSAIPDAAGMVWELLIQATRAATILGARHFKGEPT